MRQSMIKNVTLCKCCRKAFIMNVEGDDETCDSCLEAKEKDD